MCLTPRKIRIASSEQRRGQGNTSAERDIEAGEQLYPFFGEPLRLSSLRLFERLQAVTMPEMKEHRRPSCQ